MNTLNKDSNSTLKQDALILNPQPIDKPQDLALSSMMKDMVKACNEMTQDPVLRKKIGMMLV
jgi:hypothetical protein